MGIWEWVALKSEAVKRDAPDATPVKNSCRNSYNRSSAAFAKIDQTVGTKIDQTVRTIVLRRVAQRTPADEIPAKEAETDRGVLDANSMKNSGTSSCAYGYGFIAFAKLGYTVRVKVIYRIVHWMKNDGTKSITTIYTTNFAQNAELHESKAGNELIPGQAFVMPVEKECMNSYTFGFITFARIGYVVRVNVHRFGQWMADDDTKARMAMYSTIFAKNICRYALQDFNKLMIPGGVGVAVFIILSNTLIDIIHEHQKLWKEKAGSPQEPFGGDLKDEVIFSGIKELLIFVVNEFIAFMMEEPFRTQFFGRGVFTMQSLVFIVRKLLVFTMKRHFGTQFLSETDEIVVAVMTALFGAGFVTDFEFHGSTTKKGRKKKGKPYSSKVYSERTLG